MTLKVTPGDIIGFKNNRGSMDLIFLVGPWSEERHVFIGLTIWRLGVNPPIPIEFTASKELNSTKWILLGNVISGIKDWGKIASEYEEYP